ncbi:hypothetical protein BOX15_Mlig008153g1, partial [Macrostomum lignano]
AAAKPKVSNPLSLSLPDRALSGILRCLDLRSLAACRLVCRAWLSRIDAFCSGGACVGGGLLTAGRAVRQLCGGGSSAKSPTAWQALQLSRRCSLVCSTLKETDVQCEEELLPSLPDLQLLPMSDKGGRGRLMLRTRMLDRGRCRLINRLLKVPQIPEDAECSLKFCATSWIGLVICRFNDGTCVVTLPLRPGDGGLGGDEVLTQAVISPPISGIFPVVMATHKCAKCGQDQLLVYSMSLAAPQLSLWSLPPAADSFGRSPQVIGKPHSVLQSGVVGSDEEALRMLQVASPVESEFAVFAVMNSNDEDTLTTVSFVRAGCRQLSLLRSRISLGGDECGFITDSSDGVLVTMVIDGLRRRRGQARCQLRLRVTRHVLAGPKCTVCPETFLYNCPMPSAEVPESQPKLIGHGRQLLCVTFMVPHCLALYRPSCPQPPVVIDLPNDQPLHFLWPVGNWLNCGIDPERQSCPLLVSAGMERDEANKQSHLLSLSFSKDAPQSAVWQRTVQFGSSVSE